jgi:Dioxygenase
VLAKSLLRGSRLRTVACYVNLRCEFYAKAPDKTSVLRHYQLLSHSPLVSLWFFFFAGQGTSQALQYISTTAAFTLLKLAPCTILPTAPLPIAFDRFSINLTIPPSSISVTTSLLEMIGLGSFVSVCFLAAERSEYLKHTGRSLAHCTAKLKARGDEAANLRRRQSMAEEIRRNRGLHSIPHLKARDLDSVLNKSHLSSASGISMETPAQNLFTDNTSCILQPDSTEGPYYISGELIRKNITNGEEGIPLHLDIQIVDTASCDPVSGIYLDIWHCNATGVYGGVVANGNGDSSDSSNLKNNAFRGLQKTDQNGIVQFETLFPGHYAGKPSMLLDFLHVADSCRTYQSYPPSHT